MKYNGMNVPATIKTGLIISAFENAIEPDKLQLYTDIMSVEMLGHSFPPIQGYPHEIDDSDIGGYFLNGNPIEWADLGKIAWKVTDGHHRSLAAIEANLPYIETALDYSCITEESELKQF